VTRMPWRVVMSPFGIGAVAVCRVTAAGCPDSPVLTGDEKMHCVWQDVGESMQHKRAVVRDDRPLHPDGEPCGAYLIVFACWVSR